MNEKIVAIVGPTASGKSKLALELAQMFNGEIICADSRTVYKEFDIGTAKPSLADQKKIKHHCIDIINPNEMYSVAKFKEDAQTAINVILSKSKLPIIVGGSGLYLDALLYNFDINTQNVNQVDHSMTLNELNNLASKLGLNVPEQTMKNKQHLIRFIERGGVSSRSKSTSALIIGIKVDDTTLKRRINDRVEKMFQLGVVDETKRIIKKWGTNIPSINSSGYRCIVRYLKKEINLDDTKNLFIREHYNLAKKQKTWFKRNNDIVWISNFKDIEQLINKYLIQ